MQPSYGVMFVGVGAMFGGLLQLAADPTPAAYGLAALGALLAVERMQVNRTRALARRAAGSAPGA